MEREGFTAYGATFNHVSEAGLTHVVNLQLSKYVTELNFAVNLGVYLDEVAEILAWPRASKAPVEASQCQFRTRLSTLVFSSDIWSGLSKQSIDEVSRQLQNYGLPFLKRWSTRGQIVEEWARRQEEAFWRSWANPLVMGVLIAKYGDRGEAHELLQAQYKESRGTPGAHIVEQTMRRLGFPIGAA